MRDFRGELADRVRKQRVAKGWSQTELARRWSRSRHSVVRVEKGEVEPDLNVLAGLADALEISLSELVWPLLEPEDAQKQRLAAGQKFRAQQEQVFRRYLEGLDNEAAERALLAISIIAAEGNWTELAIALETLAGIVSCVINRRLRETGGSFSIPFAWVRMRHRREDWPILEANREAIEQAIREDLAEHLIAPPSG